MQRFQNTNQFQPTYYGILCLIQNSSLKQLVTLEKTFKTKPHHTFKAFFYISTEFPLFISMLNFTYCTQPIALVFHNLINKSESCSILQLIMHKKRQIYI
jgi:hypothetical protein